MAILPTLKIFVTSTPDLGESQFPNVHLRNIIERSLCGNDVVLPDVKLDNFLPNLGNFPKFFNKCAPTNWPKSFLPNCPNLSVEKLGRKLFFGLRQINKGKNTFKGLIEKVL